MLARYDLPVTDHPFQPVDRFTLGYMEKLCPVMFCETVKASCISDTFKRFLVYGALVDSFDEIKNIHVWAILQPLADDTFNGRFSYTFEATQPEPDLTFIVDRKSL